MATFSAVSLPIFTNFNSAMRNASSLEHARAAVELAVSDSPVDLAQALVLATSSSVFLGKLDEAASCANQSQAMLHCFSLRPV